MWTKTEEQLARRGTEQMGEMIWWQGGQNPTGKEQEWWGCRARTDMELSYRRFWKKGLPFYGCCGAATVI
jgi:hypothetical protein